MASNNTTSFNPQTHFGRWKLLHGLDENTLASIKWFIAIDKRLWFCTQDDHLFARGKNDWGQLGIGHKDDVDTPTLVVGLEGQQVVDIVGSEGITLALTQHGRVYAWGANNYKQLENICEGCITRPKHIESLKNIVSITCGRAHSMSLNKHGKMFIWGYNYYGQIGNNSWSTQSHPIQLDMFTTEVITQIQCGARSSMILLNNGDVLAWGSLFGKTQYTPVKVNVSNQKVKQIACANDALVSLTQQGQIFIHRDNITTPQLMQPQSIEFTSVLIIDYSKFDRNQSASFVLASSGTQQVYHTNGKGEGSIQFTKLGLPLSDVIVHHSSFQVSPLKMTLNLSHEDDQIVAVSKQIIDSFDREDSSDMVFLFPNGKKIHGNRSFLSFFSPYMRTMLSNTSAEESVMEVTEYSYSLYHNYIRYLYTGSLPTLTLSDLMHLYNLAHRHDEEKLKDKCMRLISQHLDVNNCCKLYEFCVKYNLEDFKGQVIKLARENFAKIPSDSFDEIKPTNLLSFNKSIATK